MAVRIDFHEPCKQGRLHENCYINPQQPLAETNPSYPAPKNASQLTQARKRESLRHITTKSAAEPDMNAMFFVFPD